MPWKQKSVTRGVALVIGGAERQSKVGKQRMGVGKTSMWCVFTATAALGRSGSIVCDRNGRWRRTGQHNSISIGARGCWNERGATGSRGLRVRVVSRVRVRGRVINTLAGTGRGRVRVKHPQWFDIASDDWRDRERCTGIRIRKKVDGGCCWRTGHPQ